MTKDVQALAVRTLRRRLGFQIAAAAGAALSIAGTAFVIFDAYTFERFIHDELTAQVEVIATQVSAALEFGDHVGAASIMRAVATSRAIASVAICDESNRAIAHHAVRATTTPCSDEGVPFAVEASSSPEHRVVVRADPAPFEARTLRFSLVVAGLFAPTMLLALFLAYRIRATMEVFQELDRGHRRAEAAARAKNEFLANVSHEIRTPINGLIGTSELLLETAVGEEQRSLATAMHECSNALMSVLTDVIDLARIDDVERKLAPTSLRALVLDQATLFRGAAQRGGVALRCEIDEAVPERSLLDAPRLRQVIANLLSNAVAFTQEGSIEVSLRRIGETNGMSTIEIAVVDSGLGIAPEQHERIFERFVQADASATRTHGGLGLGLAIAKEFVERVGGTITVDSRLGEGARFVVRLELEDVAITPTIEQAVSERLLSDRILLVEDNVVNRKVAMKMLARLGCEVDFAVDGQQAVEKFRVDAFDLVLMDCQMPRMDGYAATEEIRRRERAADARPVPILALTANVLPEDLERCVASGMNGYIAKPASLATLRSALSNPEVAAFERGVPA